MALDYEYETTCGIVFDGSLYGHIKDALLSRCKTEPVEETVDVYRDPEDTRGRYRESTRFERSFAANDVQTVRKYDHKKTVYIQEAQIPYVEETRGRVIFVTCTYKVSVERLLTSEEWRDTVKEDHMSGRYSRTNNKKRICFYADAFETNIPYTRVSVGETSTYGGTLEARSTCNSIYFLEIEHETKAQLDSFSIRRAMSQLIELLFELVPYDLVRRSMFASNTCSVQRERIDNIFDTFKRSFQNYERRSSYLRGLERSETKDEVELRFFVMPKWDGVRAVGLYYCEGHLLVKDACGRLASFNTRLPFDNDMVFQIEAVGPEPRGDKPNGRDSAGRYYVITELMAVLVKSQNTMFQVYGRNTVAHDTCRNIGNIVDGVSVKTQFADDSHVCNLYRLLSAETSLHVLSALTSNEQMKDGVCGCGIVTLTAVARVPVSNAKVLRLMDDFVTIDVGRESKRRSLAVFSKWLPPHTQNNRRLDENCEGLILAFTVFEKFRPCKKVNGVVQARVKKKSNNCFDQHGYFKLKHVDTVDLELNLNDGTLKSADGTAYAAEGLPTLSSNVDDDENDNCDGEDDRPRRISGWAERPVPVKNRRVIVECYFDGEKLRFLKDRYDKSRPDSDSKIIATDKTLYTNCIVAAHKP